MYINLADGSQFVNTLMVEFSKYIETKTEGAYRLLPTATVYVCIWEVYPLALTCYYFYSSQSWNVSANLNTYAALFSS